LILALTLVFSVPFLAAGEYVSLAPTMEPLAVRVLESGGGRTVLEYTVGGYDRVPVQIGGETYYQIRLGEEGTLLEAGLPELPTVGRSVIVPDNAEMAVRVLESSWVEEAGVRVAPSKGNLLRTVDPATVPYEFGSVYASGGVYPSEAAYGSEPYIMRDYRGMVVTAQPFQYDAGRGVLRVCSRMVVEVSPVGVGKANVLTRRPAKVNAEFDQMYRSLFVNYEQARDRYTPVDEVGGMLVICYGDYMTAMQPFVEWKKQMGIPCEMVSVAAAGGDTTGIKSTILNYYNAHDLAFVLLVGDAAQCPPLRSGGAYADPPYSLLAGSDRRPEIIVGRFSAESAAQVETQVTRVVEYEKTPQAGAAWYHKGTGIGSQYGPGDDGEYDYEHIALIRDDLLGFTYTEVDTITGPTGTAAMVTAALNDGRSVVNYAGHGSSIGWGTTSFTTSHVNALENDNMLPFIVAAACFNGQFTNPTCFAEAWLRASRGGEPTGAVGAYMSSISQSWNPPMDAEDEAVDLLVGASAHGVRRTFGGLCYNGANHMMDEYVDTGSREFMNWNVFGDPSLRVRTDTPETLAVSHAAAVDPSASSFSVTVAGVEGALCALYAGGTLYGAGVTDGAGQASIPLAPPLPAQTVLTLTVTAFNAVPHFADVYVGEVLNPILSVAPTSLEESMEPDATLSDTLTLSNVGEPLSVLSFTVEVVDRMVSRRVETARISLSPASYEPGAACERALVLENDTDGDVWLDAVSLLLPDGVEVTGASDLATESRALRFEAGSGEVGWVGDWWNVVRPGETARATLTLSAAPGVEGAVELLYSVSSLDRHGERSASCGAAALAGAAGASVTVTSPNGGEFWAAGEARTITWTSSGAGDLVALSWSDDGGESWGTIAPSTENDGSFEWTCGAPSSECLVRVRALDAPAQDTSDLAFTLSAPVSWLSASPLSGNIPRGTGQPIAVSFDTSGLPDGDYFADVRIESNGGDAIVPVTLCVRSTGVDDRMPVAAVLYGAFPNPFNPETRVAFGVPSPQRVRVSVYDVAGRLVRVLADREFEAGNQFVTWDGRSGAGNAVASGVYFCRMTAAGFTGARAMVLLK